MAYKPGKENFVKNLKILVRIPDEIKEYFWDQLLANNWRLMSVVSLLAIFVQAVNILHVLIGSASGLGTLNNRIYFGFYCVFLLMSLIFLGVHRIFNKKKWKKGQKILQSMFCAFWIIWSCLLSYYDIIGAQDGGNLSVIVTSIMGAAIIVQVVPLYGLCVYGLSVLFFSVAAYDYIRFGGLINVMIAGGMAVIVSGARYWYKVKELTQQQKIQEMNRKLQEEHEKLNLSLEKFQLLMDKMDHIIYEWDIEQGKISFSAEWMEKFGETSQISDDARWFEQTDCMAAEVKQKFLRGMEKAMKERTIYEDEIPLRNKEGTVQWYLLRLYFQYSQEGIARSAVGFLINIQKQKEELENLEGEVSRDYLTGVMNRKGIQEYTEKELEQKKPDRLTAMVLIDLDNFKQINDKYGHPFGDQVLVHTGEILSGLFASGGTVGRIGGDEFMAVLSVKNREELRKKIEELKGRSVNLEYRGERVQTEFCAGTAVAETGDDYQTLYQKADQALYQAKETGRGEIYLAG